MKQKTTILLLFVFLSIFTNLPNLGAHAYSLPFFVSNYQKEVKKGEKYIFDIEMKAYGNAHHLRYSIDDGEWVQISDIDFPYRAEIETDNLDFGYHKLEVYALEGDLSTAIYALTFKVLPAIEIDVYNIVQTEDSLSFDIDIPNKEENTSYDLYYQLNDLYYHLNNTEPEVTFNLDFPYRKTVKKVYMVDIIEIYIRSGNLESDHYFLTAQYTVNGEKIYTPPDTSSRPLAQNPKPVSTSSAPSKLKPSSSQPTSAAPLDHNSTAVWIVFAAAGLVLIAGAVSFVLIRKKKK